MPTPAELLGTAICTALLGPTPPAASLQKHIDWAQAFLDNYAGGQGEKGDPGDAPYDTLPVEWGEDSATPPAAVEQYAAGDAICRLRKFAQAEDQTLIFLWHVPENIDPEYPIIKYRVKGVKTESGAVADKALLFTLAGFCAGHGDAIGGTVGSAVDSELLDWSPSEGDVFFTDWSATAVVLSGLVAGGLAFLHLTRDNSVADNYPNPVGVILLEIQYNRLLTP